MTTLPIGAQFLSSEHRNIMKIYVASAFGNRFYVREVIELLRDDLHEITHDWTHDKFTEDAAELRAAGLACMLGVVEADVFVMIPKPDSVGSWIEMGMALMLRQSCSPDMQIVLVGDERGNVVFEALDNVHRVETIAELRATLMLWDQDCDDLWEDE